MLWIIGPVAVDYLEYLARKQIRFGQFIPTGVTGYGAETILLDFSSQAGLLESLAKLSHKPTVTSVLVTGLESYVVPAAYIARHFGVLGIPLAAAQAATDKIIMRQKFADYDTAITPVFRAVENWQDIEQFYQENPGSVMLKPANLMKSLYVTRNDSLEQLKHNYQQLQAELDEVYRQYHLNRPRILVEAHMQGSMHTVAGFVDQTGELQLIQHSVDCTTAPEIGIDDSYLFARTIPTRSSPKQEQELWRVTKAGVAALGLKNTAIHAELILTSTGPKIIEIAARIGGYRPRMYEQAFGLDLYDCALRTASGIGLELVARQRAASTVIELFPERTARFDHVEGLETIQRLATLRQLKLKSEVGDKVGKASDGYRASAVVNLAGDPQAVQADTDTVRNYVRICTK